MKLSFFIRGMALIGLLIILVVGIFYWNHTSISGGQARYSTQVIKRGNITQLASANGTLNPVVLVNVGTQVSGTVRKWFANFNDHVKAGQILLELDPALYRAQLKQSEANLANARAQLKLNESNANRARELMQLEYISHQDFDTSIQNYEAAKAQLALAQAQVEKDRTNLGYTVIRSPVSGTVVSREVDIGQTVAASFQTPTLFKIAQDLSKMQIDSSYAEADIGNIQVGQSANFRVDAFPDRVFQGHVNQIRLNPTIQQNVVTYDVVITVENPEQLLLPGMTAYVNILIAQRKDVLMIPNAALRFRPELGTTEKSRNERASQQVRNKAENMPMGTVYIIENAQPKAIHVPTGITDSRQTEYLGDELKEGDQVIVEDHQPTSRANTRSGLRLF